MEKRTRSHKRVLIGTHVIHFRANTENIKLFMPADLSSFSYSMACTYCGHVLKELKISAEQYTPEGSQRKVNYCAPCPECKKEMCFIYVETYIDRAFSDYSNWNKIFMVDCKGCRIDIIECNKWIINSISGQEYEWDGKEDFFDFDEKLEKPLGIAELDFNVVTLIE